MHDALVSTLDNLRKGAFAGTKGRLISGNTNGTIGRDTPIDAIAPDPRPTEGHHYIIPFTSVKRASLLAFITYDWYRLAITAGQLQSEKFDDFRVDANAGVTLKDNKHAYTLNKSQRTADNKDTQPHPIEGPKTPGTE